MSKKIVLAVMHCTKKQFFKVIELAFSVIEKMYSHATEYPNPPEPEAILQKAADDAAAAQALVKDGGKLERANRDVAIGALFDLLETKFLPYVNGLYRNKEQMLLLSGFEVSRDPVAVGVPPTPVINRIEKGTEPGSVKIILEKSTGPLNERKVSLMYFVYQTDDPLDETKLKLVLMTSNSRKLIITDVPRGVDMYYCVSAYHGKNGTELCGKIKYMLN
jgi:hypothetical protein